MAIVTVEESAEALAAAAAERVTALIEQAVASRGSALVCLTGGRTPERLYELLADAGQPWRARIDWPRVHVFWGDERHVPPDHPDSNFGMAHRALVAHVPIPAAQIHRMRGETPDATEAAQEYETALGAGFSLAGHAGDGAFDVMLLGIGEDAHIASIFPGSRLLDHEHHPAQDYATPPLPEGPPRESAPRVAAVWVEHLGVWRITLTPPVLLEARAILVLASDERKAPAVRAALEAPEDVSRYPAQLLRAAGDRVEWMLTRPELT